MFTLATPGFSEILHALRSNPGPTCRTLISRVPGLARTLRELSHPDLQTQQGLSAALGVSQGFLSKCETADRIPSAEFAHRWMMALVHHANLDALQPAEQEAIAAMGEALPWNEHVALRSCGSEPEHVPGSPDPAPLALDPWGRLDSYGLYQTPEARQLAATNPTDSINARLSGGTSGTYGTYASNAYQSHGAAHEAAQGATADTSVYDLPRPYSQDTRTGTGTSTSTETNPDDVYALIDSYGLNT